MQNGEAIKVQLQFWSRVVIGLEVVGWEKSVLVVRNLIATWGSEQGAIRVSPQLGNRTHLIQT